MEIILILLTSTLMSAFAFLVYKVGYTDGTKQIQKKEIELNERNAESIEQLANWLNFRG